MISLSSHLASHLKIYACEALSAAYDKAISGIASQRVSPSQRESWHVAYLCQSIATMTSNWRAALTATQPGIKLSMSSVFTHQSPYVKWSAKRCELADLLVAVIDKSTTSPYGYAVLIQAKLSAHGGVTLTSKSEKTQFELFTQRPSFDIDSTNSPQHVDLLKHTPDSAFMYGLATENPFSSIPICSHSWWVNGAWLTEDNLMMRAGTHQVHASDCMSSVLIGMLQGNFGWRFNMPPVGQNWHYFDSTTPRDSWSTLINYLLEETFTKPLSKGHSIASNRTNRGQNDVIYLSSVNSYGFPSFFVADGVMQSCLPLNFENVDNYNEEWRVGNINMDISGHGGGVNIPENLLGDERPNGPISAIVFEIDQENKFE